MKNVYASQDNFKQALERIDSLVEVRYDIDCHILYVRPSRPRYIEQLVPVIEAQRPMGILVYVMQEIYSLQIPTPVPSRTRISFEALFAILAKWCGKRGW